MANELITIKTGLEFKSKALTTATKAIYDAYFKADKVTRESYITIARTLAHVENGKSYKEDGFGSLAEYAEGIGLNKSMAHKLENAGRMLESSNATIRDFAVSTDWSKLAILASADEKDVVEAIESGELTSDSTQADVKAWKANTNAKKAPEKVLPNFEVDITFANGDTIHYDSIAIEAISEFDGYVKVGAYKAEDGTTITFMYNPVTMNMARYTATKVKTTKKVKKAPDTIDVAKLPDDVIRAMIEEYKSRFGGDKNDD